MSHSPRGSLWHRWDLHFHTPSSFDYDDKSISNQQIVDCLVGAGLRAVAITDHHAIDVARIRELQKIGIDKLTVLPGIELRGDHGGEPIHYICIFSETCDLDHVWTTLQGSLGLTPAAIKDKGGDQKIYVPIEDAARETRKLGGVVSIHAGAKSNSIEGISNREQFQQRIKYDITKGHVDLMEIGQLKDIDRHAVAKRLIEKLDNFQKDYEVFVASLEEDAAELGLKATDMVTMAITNTGPTDARDKAVTSLAAAKQQLDATDPPGLRQQLVAAEARIVELQSKLDAPNRAYQAYLKGLADWQSKRTEIEGTEKTPESLNGLQASLAALDQLPEKIAHARKEQAELALQIHTEKSAQAAVYRNLYGSVQRFIDSHVLAKDKLKLEFRAELTNEDFGGRLLSLLSLNRKGSFMGIDEGRARADFLVQAVNWEAPESVGAFLAAVDTALHVDQRPGQGGEVQLRDQLSKGKKPEEVFDLLYGLEYVRPRYILRWEGKDLSMLSPGERGTLLLVFYLLIDKGDMPLVIDQPEGNLDNHTVAKVLVQCIKEARKRRQVFIVTHNPNLAVVCDADQVVHASMNKTDGNAIAYDTGSLENPAMTQYVTDVLEGTRWAFGVRGAKYEVGD